jgi:hypothetical protein
MTAPTALDTTPLTPEQMTWMREYEEARKTVRWAVHTPATSNLAMRWPAMAGTYAGWQLEPEPEPPSRWARLKARFF